MEQLFMLTCTVDGCIWSARWHTIRRHPELRLCRKHARQFRKAQRRKMDREWEAD